MAGGIIFVEASIGAGKSTLLDMLEHTQLGIPHVVVKEPVDQWMTARANGETRSLFEMFYQDRERYGFSFQLFALSTRIAQLRHVAALAETHLVIVERSHFSDIGVFARLLMEDGTIDATQAMVYQSVHAELTANLGTLPILGALYLRAPPSVCMQRIAHRCREGEHDISPQYMQRMHDTTEDWVTRLPFEVYTVDAQGTASCTHDQAVAGIGLLLRKKAN